MLKSSATASTISECRYIDFPKIIDTRGNLTFIEGKRHLPFEIRRVFFIYDIPSGEVRGAHAHRRLRQVIVCLSGSLDVVVNDGREQKTIHLNRPTRGLYLPPMIWANMENFDSNTIYAVMASTYYDESDYIRDFSEFVKLAKGATQ